MVQSQVHLGVKLAKGTVTIIPLLGRGGARWTIHGNCTIGMVKGSMQEKSQIACLNPVTNFGFLRLKLVRSGCGLMVF